MKKQYPSYARGELKLKKEKLRGVNKKIFNDFMDLICTTIKRDSIKMHNVERAIIQFHDVIEKDLDKINKDDVIKFFALFNSSDRRDSFKDELKVYVKKFLKWYYKDLEMVEAIKLSNTQYNEKRLNKNALLTTDELKQIMDSTDNPRFKAWFMLSYESAGRPEEILKLRWKDIKFKEGYAEVSLFSGKTGHARGVIIKESSKLLKLWKEISPYSSPQDYVFFSIQNKDEHTRVESMNALLKRSAKKAGIDKPVWNYLLRHSNLTKLYSKLPQRLVEKFAGHKGMAEIYGHFDDEDIKQAMLKEIYNVKELTKEEINQIEKLKKEIQKVKNENKYFAHWIKIFTEMYAGKITQKEATLRMKALSKAVDLEN